MSAPGIHEFIDPVTRNLHLQKFAQRDRKTYALQAIVTEECYTQQPEAVEKIKWLLVKACENVETMPELPEGGTPEAVAFTEDEVFA